MRAQVGLSRRQHTLGLALDCAGRSGMRRFKSDGTSQRRDDELPVQPWRCMLWRRERARLQVLDRPA
ncbi:hypothetical protein [Mumia zhuanghuii]|uniref:Uncharacterized protein n=1 Tax=Mumia zhuanghuii TaxID=2585211 RepID=A0A5C4M951_9ACTN|nr:hypothetical protein [Mumia zhuanghuii]TNC28429.1 hypothetical protein FHE65_33960 [Mumia zhuanghuii]